MGFLTGGPFYDMIGRTGNNVGRKVKGKNVFSMRPAKTTKAPTTPQLNQRLKFSLINTWLRRLAGFIDVGFKDYDSEMSPRNAAVAYNIKNAITGVAPNYTIDYPNIVYSKGKLDLPASAQVQTTVAARLDYSWTAPIGDTNALATDKVSFAVYNAAKNKFVTLKGAVVRSALTFNLMVPPDFSGDDVQAYMSFVSADGKLVSDSIYIGEFLLL